LASRATPARAEAWFDKHNRTPPELKTTLAAAAKIPVDIRPIFSFPGEGAIKRRSLFLLAAIAAAQSPAHQPAGTIVVDATEFYDAIPAGDSMGGGFGNSNTGWLFNDRVLTLGSKEDAVAKVAVPRQADIASSCAARALREAVSVSIWTPGRPMACSAPALCETRFGVPAQFDRQPHALWNALHRGGLPLQRCKANGPAKWLLRTDRDVGLLGFRLPWARPT